MLHWFYMIYLSFFLAAVASFAVGMAWYSPFLFGKPWMKLMGMTEKSLKKGQSEMGTWFELSFVLTVLPAGVLSWVLQVAPVWSVGDALVTAGYVWLGFIVPTQATDLIFNDKPFSHQLLVINASYQLASVLVMAMVMYLV